MITEHLTGNTISPILAQAGAVSCSAVTWIACGILNADTVTEAEIKVSLPIFITSIIATAGFTWVVAKYDNARLRKMDELQQQMKDLTAMMEHRVQQPPTK